MTDVGQFRAWLATKDPEEAYTFESNTNCCYAQFLKETGKSKHPFVFEYDWRHANSDVRQPIDDTIAEVLIAVPGLYGTFGKVLKLLDERMHACA